MFNPLAIEQGRIESSSFSILEPPVEVNQATWSIEPAKVLFRLDFIHADCCTLHYRLNIFINFLDS